MLGDMRNMRKVGGMSAWNGGERRMPGARVRLRMTGMRRDNLLSPRIMYCHLRLYRLNSVNWLNCVSSLSSLNWLNCPIRLNWDRVDSLNAYRCRSSRKGYRGMSRPRIHILITLTYNRDSSISVDWMASSTRPHRLP